jgi:hypothetical protein
MQTLGTRPDYMRANDKPRARIVKRRRAPRRAANDLLIILTMLAVRAFC